MLLRLAVSGQYRWYVQSRMGIALIISALVLLLLGGINFFSSHEHDDEHDDEHGYDHGHGSSIAWLLVIPVLAVLVVSPPPLGGWGAQVESNQRITNVGYASLPKTKKPIPMPMLDFVGRSFEASSPTLRNRTVELVGFGVPPKTGEGFILLRYSIACCAADAFVSQVRVMGQLPRVAKSTNDLVWLRVTGKADGVQNDLPRIRPTKVEEINQPGDPYE